MTKIIVTEATVDKAITSACKQLNVTSDKIQYKVLNHSKKSSTIEAWANETKKLQQSKLRPCQDCGKEISRKAEVCPHCGCPVEKTVTCPYCDYDTDKTYEQIQALGYYVECENCGKKVAVSTPEQELRWSQQKLIEANQPKCPTCGSTNIEKISVSKKAFGGFLFGVFSSDVRNTMHCKNCGAKW